MERVRNLNEKEIKEFTAKYNLIWDIDIFEVSLLEYGRIKEYLVNDKYLVVDYSKDSIMQREL